VTTSPSDVPDHVHRNREFWDRQSADHLEPGRRAWASNEPTWGIWNIPEAEVQVVPDVAGKDVVELGCGTAYWSAWLARRGARVVGVDLSAAQLASARTLQREHALAFPLVQASGESVPLVDRTFDLALSEYGASIWCDPYRWVPEAARLLRPGGDLLFLNNSALLMLCLPPDGGPAGDRLARDYFGMHRFEWPDDSDVEFHLAHGDWIRLLRANGFVVLDLVELRAPAGAATGRFAFVTPEWARRWPSEEIWHVRKAGA
jgi:SAM-dependent methyltransferase